MKCAEWFCEKSHPLASLLFLSMSFPFLSLSFGKVIKRRRILEEKTICFCLLLEKRWKWMDNDNKTRCWVCVCRRLFFAFEREMKMSVRLGGVFEFEIVCSVSDLLF